MARKADAGRYEWDYERRRPERTLLYQLVTEHYPRFIELLSAQDRTVPEYVQREFEDFLKCGRLAKNPVERPPLNEIADAFRTIDNGSAATAG